MCDVPHGEATVGGMLEIDGESIEVRVPATIPATYLPARSPRGFWFNFVYSHEINWPYPWSLGIEIFKSTETECMTYSEVTRQTYVRSSSPQRFGTAALDSWFVTQCRCTYI